MNPLRSFRLWTAALAVAVGALISRLDAQETPTPPPQAVSTAETTSEGQVVDLSPVVPAKAEKSAGKSSGGPKRHADHEEVVSVGKPEKVAQGKSASELVVVGADGTVDGETDGDAVVVGGSLFINGHVHGNAVNVGFGVHLGPEAVVDGDVVGIGGGVFKAEGAKILGNIVPIGVSVLPFFDKGVPAWLSHYIEEGVYKLRPLMFSTDAPWTIFGVLFLLHFLVAALLPSASKGVERTIVERPGATLLMAILSIPLVLFALLLLSPTVVGPLALVAASLVAILVGKVGVVQFLGGRLVAPFGAADLPPVARFLVGSVLVTLLYATPYIGFFVWFSLSLWGFGAATLALFSREGSVKSAKSAAPTPEASRPATEGIRLATEVPGGMAFAAPAAATVVGTAATTIPEVPASGNVPGATSTGPAPGGFADAGFAGGTAGASGSARPAGPGSFRESSGDWLRQSSMPGLDAAEMESLPRPTFLPRAAALILDWIVIGIVFGMLPDRLHDGPGFLILVSVAYYAAMVAWRGASLGGLLFRFQVVRLDGRPLDRATALVRAASAILSGLCGLGWFWAFWDSERQTWHDKLAGTVVVQVQKVRPLV